MTTSSARTDFVRKAIEGRPSGYDAFVEDLLRIERALGDLGPKGVASTMSYLNLIARYPRETEAIARELGTSVLTPLDDERIDDLVGERVRLAEARSLEGRRTPEDLGDF